MPGGLPVASIRTPSDSCSSSIPTLCITPLQGTTSSSKPAVIPVAGWIERLRPSRGWRPSPLRRSSGGVGIAPAATTTIGRRDPHLAAVGALGRGRRLRGRPRSAPALRAGRRRSARPASQACGRALRWTPPLALLGQPIAHWQAPRQPGALRRRGALCQSSAAAPSSASSPLRPSTSIGAGATPIVASTSAIRGPSSSRSARAKPCSLCQEVATAVGRPEAGAGVDHGGAADGAAERQRDRRVAQRHRRAAVAVDAGEAVERVRARGSAPRSSARPPRRSRCRARPGPVRERRRRRRRRSRSRSRRSSSCAATPPPASIAICGSGPRGLVARADRGDLAPRTCRPRGRA